ncbi:hypothetical protein L1987_51943 [Smallanthus sonchifolius]|uniref:Uncharacterized protein n=1 Tax=Smallanthus sonchifolius TaxID=185202 RepID=A0ACB9ESC0_9ASTR|nr:hypothetical protein L1987_51943 [Smallanthus sonchifolius]
MSNNLASDCLANIFSYLPPHSLARAMAACRHWHDCRRSTVRDKIRRHQHPPWFIALPTHNNNLCFVHNPIEDTWHLLNLDHVPSLSRPVSTVGGHALILFKSTGVLPLRVLVCNPFTSSSATFPRCGNRGLIRNWES